MKGRDDPKHRVADALEEIANQLGRLADSLEDNNDG